MSYPSTLDETEAQANRSLLLVHGRDFKPARDVYFELSLAALRAGIERDFPEKVEGFDVLQKHLAWYGDLSAEVLEAGGKTYDRDLDVGDRKNALNALRAITARKRFGIREYDSLPGKSALPEFFADIAAPILGSLGLAKSVVKWMAADVAAYFTPKLDYAEKVRSRLRDELCELMNRGDRILLVSHGTGSVIAYDVLWQLSHDETYAERYANCKIDLWLTLGSPLGDSHLQKRILGADGSAQARYPANIISWYNVSAEDDYTCHDDTVRDDFNKMLQQRVVSVVHDFKIFNLAVRYGRSNPHSSIGYYIHPRVSKIIADWLG